MTDLISSAISMFTDNIIPIATGSTFGILFAITVINRLIGVFGNAKSSF